MIKCYEQWVHPSYIQRFPKAWEMILKLYWNSILKLKAFLKKKKIGRAFPKSYHVGLIFLHIVLCLSDGDHKLAMKTERAITGCCLQQLCSLNANDSEDINTVRWNFILLFLFVAPSFPNSILLSPRYKLTWEFSPNNLFCFQLLFNFLHHLLFNFLQHKNHTYIPSQSLFTLMHALNLKYNKI